MIRKLLTAAAGLCLTTFPAFAQPAAPTGSWRCVANSPSGTIDLNLNVAPNGQLTGNGSVIYSGSYAAYNVQGSGDWLAMPPDSQSNEWLFKFRLHPSNHPIVVVYARPTNDPNFLNNTFYNPQTGMTTNTSCQKQG